MFSPYHGRLYTREESRMRRALSTHFVLLFMQSFQITSHAFAPELALRAQRARLYARRNMLASRLTFLTFSCRFSSAPPRRARSGFFTSRLLRECRRQRRCRDFATLFHCAPIRQSAARRQLTIRLRQKLT